MKKILLLLLLLMIVPVKANRLYLVTDKSAIKYESGQFDEKIFMKHTDMVPGSKYTDELVIENGTNKAYKLYFKANKKDQSKEADELLNSILMKITLDGKLIYDGKANGIGNIDLTNSIYLGEFVPNKSVKMKVETYLSTDYENPKNSDLSHIDWTFYAQLEDEPPQEVVPITGSSKSNIIVIGSITLLTIAFVVFIIYKYKNKKAI